MILFFIHIHLQRRGRSGENNRNKNNEGENSCCKAVKNAVRKTEPEKKCIIVKKKSRYLHVIYYIKEKQNEKNIEKMVVKEDENTIYIH